VRPRHSSKGSYLKTKAIAVGLTTFVTCMIGSVASAFADEAPVAPATPAQATPAPSPEPAIAAPVAPPAAAAPQPPVAASTTLDSADSSAHPADSAHAEPKKEPFVEKGRFGILGALTDDMWKVGAVFEHQHFEASVLFHAGFESGDTRDLHFIFKAGGRVPLGALNYLAIGGEYGPHWASREAGISTGGSFHVGPYMGLQRYFAGTPLMINLWVCPVSYEYFENNDGAGGLAKTKTVHAFRQGGFGLAYLF
jgi:hypothetical protein